MAMRVIGPQERRARLGLRHHLADAARAATPAEAARGVVALHATDPASVFLAAAARCGPPGTPADVGRIEHALYTERSLVRLLGMRRTMFVVPAGLVPVIQAGCAQAVAAAQRRRYLRLMAEAGLGDGPWLRDVEDATARALAARGEATGAQLADDEPRLRSQLVMAAGKPYEARQSITSWVLLLLAADGRIVRGRPAGSWLSTQWRWAPAESWLPDGLPDLPPELARAELARCWLAAFGPGTEADLRWWTGWTAGQVRQALAAIGPAEVDLGGRTGLVLPEDAGPVAGPEPWVALLPALDPTAMGWSERSWYLGPHAPALMDTSGNIGPTVWSDGRVIGGWACRPGGEIAWRLLEDVGRDTEGAVAGAAGRLAGWLGGTQVVPRFRTPLERELSR
jgi:hypothetical protein